MQLKSSCKAILHMALEIEVSQNPELHLSIIIVTVQITLDRISIFTVKSFHGNGYVSISEIKEIMY